MNFQHLPESARLALRPAIPQLSPAQSTAEQFQNETLRPILKLQNELIIQLFRHFLQKRKVRLQGLSPEQGNEWIANSIRKDNRLRNLLLGLVIGQFTPRELDTFFTIETEARRRTFDLLIQRLQSQMAALY